MKLNQLAVLLATVVFAAAAFSGEPGHRKIELVVVDSADSSETRIQLDSDDLEIRLHDMVLGQNQSIVDKDGRAILITRVEDGFTFDVDGKTIRMPALGGYDGERVGIHKGSLMPDFDIRFMHHGMRGRTMDTDSVMIVSGAAIDEATQQLIRTTLESAGHSSVTFVGSDERGQRHIRIIKEVAEVIE